VMCGTMRLWGASGLIDSKGMAGWPRSSHGHSHFPHLQRKDGVFSLNPGAAGPRRFTLPVSLARLKVNHDSIQAELVALKV